LSCPDFAKKLCNWRAEDLFEEGFSFLNFQERKKKKKDDNKPRTRAQHARCLTTVKQHGGRIHPHTVMVLS